MTSRVVIVDYGMGNLNSIKKAMDRLKVESIISSDPADISDSRKIILPGVGHFKKAMSNLNELNLIDALNEEVLFKKKPILGICLGMQLFAEKSEEGNCNGLGWLNAEVVKFATSDKSRYKVPHMGWNQIFIKKKSLLMNNISELSEFYFVHSYHIKLGDKSDLLNETRFDCNFTSAIEKENIFGVQYHPEKSHDVGLSLLKNFIEL